MHYAYKSRAGHTIILNWTVDVMDTAGIFEGLWKHREANRITGVESLFLANCIRLKNAVEHAKRRKADES